MYTNIGEKIKTLAKVLFVIGLVVSLIYGVLLLNSRDVLRGTLCIVIGGLSSWVSTFVLYGFGQLIVNSDKILKGNKRQKVLLQKCLAMDQIGEIDEEKAEEKQEEKDDYDYL